MIKAVLLRGNVDDTYNTYFVYIRNLRTQNIKYTIAIVAHYKYYHP